MKRIKRLLIILLVILPVIVLALEKTDFDNATTLAGNYMNKGRYASSHDKYITGTGTLLKEEEFNASRGKKVTSYLFDGSSFWMQGKKIIKQNGRVETQSGNESNFVKVVEYVKPETKVTGTGHLDNPWSFEPVYKVTIKTNEYGVLGETSEEYVSKGSTPIFSVSPKSGYRYISNNCCSKDASGKDCYDETTKQIKVPAVKGNTTCTVIFGTGRYKITLNKATLDGKTPAILYTNYKDNFYRDEELKNTVTKIDDIAGKTGYTIVGYKFKNSSNQEKTLINSVKSGSSYTHNIVRNSVSEISSDLTLDPVYRINTPGVPTISGGNVTKVNGYQDTVLTCTENTSYDSDTKKYYEFGYATSTSNYTNGTITWLGNASTTNTYTVSKASHVGNRYYGCRVYAEKTDKSQKSQTVKSTTNQLVSLVLARIDFNGNSGTLSGANPVYVKYGNANVYQGRINDTTTSIPKSMKSGSSFSGWYTAASGGTKVINSDGTIVANVSGWTNASKQFILTNTSDAANTYRLYAQYAGCAVGTYNTGSNPACTACPSGYTTTSTGSNAKTQCHITCAANKIVTTADGACSGSCAGGYEHASHTVNSGSISPACTPKTITVTFNGNGGTIARNATQRFTAGVSGNKFADTGATRSGFTLLGWALSNSATEKDYNILSGVTDNWIGKHAPSVTLYAVWKDSSLPTNSIAVTNNTTAGKVKYKITCSDNVGVTGYYFGTTNPNSTAVTYTSITSNLNFSQEIEKSVSGTSVTYYLRCKDAAENQSNATSKALTWSRASVCGTEKYNYHDCMNCACSNTCSCGDPHNCPRSCCTSYSCKRTYQGTCTRTCYTGSCMCSDYVTRSVSSCAYTNCAEYCANALGKSMIGGSLRGYTDSYTCTKTAYDACCSGTCYDAACGDPYNCSCGHNCSCGANSCWDTRNIECWH